MARELSEMGYRHLSPRNLKRKHVDALVNRWLKARLATVTVKSRVSTMRWLARTIGKPNVIPRTNAELGIPDRIRAGQPSKAFTLSQEVLERVPSPYIRVSLELEEKFGLRREEACKIKPHEAHQGDWLVLKASWCKGGRERKIRIRTGEQRDLLERAKALAEATPERSLIPVETYKKHIKVYERQTYKAGIRSPHGLRHAYAPGPLPGTDWAALPGGRRSAGQGPENRCGETPGQAGAEDDYGRDGAPARPGHGNLLIEVMT